MHALDPAAVNGFRITLQHLGTHKADADQSPPCRGVHRRILERFPPPLFPSSFFCFCRTASGWTSSGCGKRSICAHTYALLCTYREARSSHYDKLAFSYLTIVPDIAPPPLPLWPSMVEVLVCTNVTLPTTVYPNPRFMGHGPLYGFSVWWNSLTG